MNVDFCMHRCGRGMHPIRLVRYGTGKNAGKVFLFMDRNDCQNVLDGNCWKSEYEEEERCPGFIEVRVPAGVFRRPPPGWHLERNNGLLFPRTDAMTFLGFDGCASDAKFCWSIGILPESKCPYAMEHALMDINHAQRVREWRRHQREAMELKKRQGGE